MDKSLNIFLEKLNTTFGERLTSVLMYGSCAVEDCSILTGAFSDVNVMVVVENLTAEDLKSAHKFVKEFLKKSKSLPVFMDKEEWFNSCDVYPMEYSDIKKRHKILAGEDIVTGLTINKKYLRLQCESEVKKLLIRLRQNYLANSFDKKIIKGLVQSSSKTFVAIFRAMLTLASIEIPHGHIDVIKTFSERFNSHLSCFDADLFLKINDFRKNKSAIKDCELEKVIQKMIDSTDCVLKYVDKFEK